ncbi:Spherulation-specific family 4 [Aspergillus pseudodeflectus]|uniref:Spherulation-specific family 4 n=1 Tax=Aspergillus pseudodeflectus TaxID=176178 RepID=A0ABR4JH22_9EURO
MPSFARYFGASLLSIAYYASSVAATGVILPLYTWPSEGAWDPVYDALAAYPEVDFYVIVNPSSGPGDSSPPASEYITGVTTLNSYANAHTVGYVRTNWADRDINDVKQDIDVYSQWATYSGSSSSGSSKRSRKARRYRSPCSPQEETETDTEPISTISPTGFVTTTTPSTPTSTSTSTSISTPSSTSTPTNQNTGITLSGIFFDEAPQSSDKSQLSYMQEAAEYVQSHSAHFASTTNTSTVIFNPGTAPDAAYFNYATHIVDFESTYDAWLGSEQKSGAGGLIDGVEEADYSQSAIIINSVPENVDYAAVVGAAVEKGVAMVYLTGDFDYKTLSSVGDVAAAILSA